MTAEERPNGNEGDGNGGNPPPPDQPAKDEPISINFRNMHDETVQFKLKKTTKMKKAMEAYSARMERQVNSFRFLADGVRVTNDSTPESLELEDGDSVEVHEEQIGGFCG